MTNMVTNPCKKNSLCHYNICHDKGLEITVTIKSNFHYETSQTGNTYMPTAQL